MYEEFYVEDLKTVLGFFLDARYGEGSCNDVVDACPSLVLPASVQTILTFLEEADVVYVEHEIYYTTVGCERNAARLVKEEIAGTDKTAKILVHRNFK